MGRKGVISVSAALFTLAVALCLLLTFLFALLRLYP